MSFGAYMLAQSRRETAFAAYDGSASALELAQIRERLAELNSQHEPLAGLMLRNMSERERLYAAAFYVVAGRMP